MSRRLIDATDCVKDLQFIRGRDNNAYWKMACDFLINKIDAMPTIEVPRLIPVTERLPTKEDADQYGRVLTVAKDVGVEIRHWRLVIRYPEMFPHWMPLPEPTKDGDK